MLTANPKLTAYVSYRWVLQIDAVFSEAEKTLVVKFLGIQKPWENFPYCREIKFRSCNIIYDTSLLVIFISQVTFCVGFS